MAIPRLPCTRGGFLVLQTPLHIFLEDVLITGKLAASAPLANKWTPALADRQVQLPETHCCHARAECQRSPSACMGKPHPRGGIDQADGTLVQLKIL
ncbi:MAG: hypothetical protein KatS3mg119_0663 [Rhodothalassiaceae bacterium]|nr:MAG: hypothetical protein KatS3mg119_0663 [Rhodothalassiaceae bacterium]